MTNLAVARLSALMALPCPLQVGDKVRVLMVYDKSTLELTIMKREPGLGYALLQ